MASRYCAALICFAIFLVPTKNDHVVPQVDVILSNGTFSPWSIFENDGEMSQLSRYKREPTNDNSATDKCHKWTTTNRITLELAVFADYALYHQFYKQYKNEPLAKTKLKTYVFAIVQQLQDIFMDRSLKPNVKIILTNYSLIQHQKFRQDSDKKIRQDMPTYMDLFCQYQKHLNQQKSWDHAVLLTGLELTHSGFDNFAGFSTSQSVCGHHTSCSLVEASSFKAIYTMAHEIGHALGMMHDNGTTDCPLDCCVMAPTIFSGSPNWSSCSVKEFQRYLKSIPCNKFCLGDSTNRARLNYSSGVPAGQLYSATDQCRQYFGPCSRQYISENNDTKSVCRELWCTSDDGLMRIAHAALDGTYCERGKWCRSGKCERAQKSMSVRHGKWSKWGPLPDDGECGDSSCTKCEIIGQLQVRRQLRSCSSPSPNNGGSFCKGDAFRGILCNKVACSNNEDADDDEGDNKANAVNEDTESRPLSIPDYATKICTKRKQKMAEENNIFVSLAGTGFQRLDTNSNQHACAIWCTTVGASYTTYTFFDPFPDGTPCGSGKFCLAGKCAELHNCNSTHGFLTNEDFRATCGSNATSTRVPTTTRAPYVYAWSAWTTCTKTCGTGVQSRVRMCKTITEGARCPQSSTQRNFRVCRKSLCPPKLTTSRPTVIPATTKTGRRATTKPAATTRSSKKVSKPVKRTTASTPPTTKRITVFPVSTSAAPHRATGRWTQWSEWTGCNGPPCNESSRRLSMRKCVSKNVHCSGPAFKRKPCDKPSDGTC